MAIDMLKMIGKPLLIGLLMFFSFSLKAQFSVPVSVGVSKPILDKGAGFHIGVNPTYGILPRFSVASQMSFLNTRISGSFISGEEGRNQLTSALIGPKWYLNSPEHRLRPYLNVLLGAVFIKEFPGDSSVQSRIVFGNSVGAFIELPYFMTGISYETDGNLALKVAYIFQGK